MLLQLCPHPLGHWAELMWRGVWELLPGKSSWSAELPAVLRHRADPRCTCVVPRAYEPVMAGSEATALPRVPSLSVSPPFTSCAPHLPLPGQPRAWGAWQGLVGHCGQLCLFSDPHCLTVLQTPLLFPSPISQTAINCFSKMCLLGAAPPTLPTPLCSRGDHSFVGAR